MLPMIEATPPMRVKPATFLIPKSAPLPMNVLLLVTTAWRDKYGIWAMLISYVFGRLVRTSTIQAQSGKKFDGSTACNGTSDIQSACLLNSMSIREASYLRFHLCPFGNSYLTARAPKIGPKSNINHLDAPIKLSWGDDVGRQGLETGCGSPEI